LSDSSDLPEIPAAPIRADPDLYDRNLLWYEPAEGRWVELPFEAFCRARGDWIAKAFGYPEEGEALTQVGPGDHRFVVCVLDDDMATCVNFIAHRYIIGADGRVDRFPTTLTEAEEAEFKQLDFKRCTAKEEPELNPEEQKRFKWLADQQWEVTRLPADLLLALKRDIPWSIQSGDHPWGGFWWQYQQHSGAVDKLLT